jgi:hypothetical protein
VALDVDKVWTTQSLQDSSNVVMKRDKRVEEVEESSLWTNKLKIGAEETQKIIVLVFFGFSDYGQLCSEIVLSKIRKVLLRFGDGGECSAEKPGMYPYPYIYVRLW